MSRIAAIALGVAIAVGARGVPQASAQVALRYCRSENSRLAQAKIDTTIDASDERRNPLYRPHEDVSPLFPLAMRRAAIDGEVRATFVVDTLGRVVRGTAQIIEESRREFGVAVCDYFDRARFEPVVVHGRKLQTRFVNVRFDFNLRRG